MGEVAERADSRYDQYLSELHEVPSLPAGHCPLEDGRVVPLRILAPADMLSPALNTSVTELRHPDLLILSWDADTEYEAPVFASVATFHGWVRKNTRPDAFYVLHVGQTPEQQGALHSQLDQSRELAASWTGNAIRLLGAVTTPLHDDILEILTHSPGLDASEIATAIPQYAPGYIRNALTELSWSRAIGRSRTSKRLPSVLGRNQWHYYPLWLFQQEDVV